MNRLLTSVVVGAALVNAVVVNVGKANSSAAASMAYSTHNAQIPASVTRHTMERDVRKRFKGRHSSLAILWIKQDADILTVDLSCYTIWTLHTKQKH